MLSQKKGLGRRKIKLRKKTMRTKRRKKKRKK
jgi:hypothetical protein